MPTPQGIKEARAYAGLTQTQAANLVHVNLNTWQKWEGGRTRMSETAWELFLIKTKNERQYAEDYSNISVNNYGGIR